MFIFKTQAAHSKRERVIAIAIYFFKLCNIYILLCKTAFEYLCNFACINHIIKKMETIYHIGTETEINVQELFSEIQDWQDDDYIKPEGSRYGDQKDPDETASFPAVAKIFECCRPYG